MKRITAVAAALILLTGCSATPARNQTYSSVSKLAKVFENTKLASKYGFTCTVEDRELQKRSVRNRGYQSSECLSDEPVASSQIFRLFVAVTPRGEAWIEEYPLIDAMPSTTGVLKGPERNWQIGGPIDWLDEVQDELGGEITKGLGPN